MLHDDAATGYPVAAVRLWGRWRIDLAGAHRLDAIPSGEALHDGLPNSKERARLARLDRAERRARGERNRERAARDATRPWHERDRPDLRRRVWRELRDEQWAFVDLRDADEEAKRRNCA